MPDETTTTATTEETTQTAEVKITPELQKKMDAVAANVRKEATASGAAAARKTLMEELGLNPDDPKAVEIIKTKMSVADQAEKAKRSAEENAQIEIDNLKKERDTEKAAREALMQERQLEKRDNSILKALTTAKAKDADDLLVLMAHKKPDLVKAVLKEDGSVDEAALKKLVDTTKADYKTSFTSGNPGSPSNNNGRTGTNEPDFGERSTVRL